MIGFTPPDPHVTVTAKAAHAWTLEQGFSYRSHRREVHVPAGQATDFASSPRPTVWLIPSYGSYTPAAVLHDYMWRVMVPEGRMGYREADQTFLEAMRLLGVAFAQRWFMWTGVRWGALLTRRGGYREWWRDAPLVLAWSLPAVILLAGPVVMIAVSLLVIAAAEALLYVPLLANRGARRAAGQDPKYVNAPKVTIRT